MVGLAPISLICNCCLFYATILNIKCEENQESNADVQYFYIMLQYIKQVAIGQNLFARNYQTEIKK
jgi:hypothetical protein